MMELSVIAGDIGKRDNFIGCVIGNALYFIPLLWDNA